MHLVSIGSVLVYGLRLGIHAGLPGVSGHVRHGDDEQAQTAQEEKSEGCAGAGEWPRVVVLDPYGLIAVNHALDRLPHDLHGDDDAQACEDEEGHGGQTERKDGGFVVDVWGFQTIDSPAINYTACMSLNRYKCSKLVLTYSWVSYWSTASRQI